MIRAEAKAVLRGHLPRHEPMSGALVGCGCGWMPTMGRSPLDQWADHVCDALGLDR